MKKIICLFAILCAITTTTKAGRAPVNFEPSAKFEKLWVDYDITEDGLKGMRIHVKFTAYGMKNMDSYLAIYYLDDDEYPLKDNNDKFESTTGDVALYKSIKPGYDPAVYDDMQLFMPYSELDLTPGTYNLTMDVKLIYQQGGVISKLTKYDFEYTKPGGPSAGAPVTSGDATFDKLWVDYDVTENGKKGMRIHVKFSLLNLKDVDCYLAIYFKKKNGDKLYGKNTEFRSTSGQSAVYKSLKAGYDEAVYDDTKLFMPYDELGLPKGKFDLKMDVNVIYKNGDLVKKFKEYDFWFTQ